MPSTAIELIATAALLLWGLRMVRTGVSRAFGARLRLWLAAGTQNRLTAFAMGLAATCALQSSTATAVMTASFAGRALIGTAMALAIMLGADVGTSLVAQALAFDISWLSPVLIIVGVATFMARDPKLARKLVDMKVDVRRFEQRSADNHFERLRAGRADTLATSSLHLDILRDLKRINAHIASVAYPILDEIGALRESRIVAKS